MPALTVKAVTKALSEYVRPDEDIVAKLNLVMPRIYAMGMWRDLLFDWSIETTNKYFSLPEHADSLLGALVNDYPAEAQAQWHDYRIAGYAKEGPSPIFGIVDDGFHPTKEDLLTGDTDDYQIEVRPVSPNTLLPSEGEVTFVGELRSGATVEETLLLKGETEKRTTSVTVTSVTQISFADLHEDVDVVAIHMNGGDDIVLGRVRGDGVSRYRRFRFENSTGYTKTARLFLKRAWRPVLNQKDILHLGNLNAIKHGLLGMLAEDNADLERAQYHWTICRQLLDEELDATRGAAKPKLSLKPAGNFTGIPNLL